MEIRTLVLNPFDENTYIVHDPETLEAAVIDPGCYNPAEEMELEEYISASGLNVKYLINTHCHLDHIFGNNFVKKTYDPEYLVPEKDMFLLEGGPQIASQFGLEMPPVGKPDGFYDESTIFRLGKFELKPLFTPGHSPGEFCLYCEKEGVLFAGDVLFNGSVGRTDLGYGDHDLLIDSIRTKLLVLPDETVVYPGHGDPTTIGVEKLHNPFLR